MKDQIKKIRDEKYSPILQRIKDAILLAAKNGLKEVTITCKEVIEPAFIFALRDSELGELRYQIGENYVDFFF